VDTFARSLHWVFLACVPVAVAGLILVLFLEEKPLRKTAWVKAATPASAEC
jgi:hypothetical protein